VGLAGAGNQAGGSSPAGADYEILPLPPAYVPYPDPQSGQADSGRLIDPVTRQFDYTADGRAEGMGTVPQIVQIAWQTLDFSAIGPLDDGAPSRAYAAYNAAVAQLISGAQLQILSFFAARVPGTNGLGVKIRWKDLTTQLEYVYPQTGA
jgi:hypothetical protein